VQNQSLTAHAKDKTSSPNTVLLSEISALDCQNSTHAAAATSDITTIQIKRQRDRCTP
jgi:hypothetical protein